MRTSSSPVLLNQRLSSTWKARSLASQGREGSDLRDESKAKGLMSLARLAERFIGNDQGEADIDEVNNGSNSQFKEHHRKPGLDGLVAGNGNDGLNCNFWLKVPD